MLTLVLSVAALLVFVLLLGGGPSALDQGLKDHGVGGKHVGGEEWEPKMRLVSEVGTGSTYLWV